MNWPEYAQTKDADIQWLDRIPTSWTSGRLGSLYFEIDQRRGDQDGLELLSVSIHRGVQLRSDLITDKEARAEDLSGYKVCRAGDIILNRMRAFQGGLGASPQDGIVSPDYMVIRPTSDVGSPFLAYLMKTNWFVEQMSSRLRGIGGTDQGNARTPRINPTDLGNIKVPLPPPDVQAKIIGFLDQETQKVDALIGKQEQLIATLREDRTATITHAVTKGLDPDATFSAVGVDLPEVPDHWQVKPIKYLGRLITGGTPSTSEEAHYSEADGGFPWFRPEDLDTTGGPSSASRSLSASGWATVPHLSAPSVHVVSIGATLGKVGYVEVPSSSNQQITAIVGAECAKFVYFALVASFERIWASSMGNTIPIISAGRLGAVHVPVPPADEQSEIIGYLNERCSKVDVLIAKANEVIATLREYRSALITDAVTGKIDVRGAA